MNITWIGLTSDIIEVVSCQMDVLYIVYRSFQQSSSRLFEYMHQRYRSIRL